MMSQEDVEAFKRGTEAYNRGDVDALLKELDPKVEWHSALLIPFGGEATVSRGHDGVREVLGEVNEALAEVHLDYSEIRDLGDRIAGIGRIRTRGKQSGVVTEMAFGTVTHMKNGKAIRIWTTSIPKRPSKPPSCGSSSHYRLGRPATASDGSRVHRADHRRRAADDARREARPSAAP